MKNIYLIFICFILIGYLFVNQKKQCEPMANLDAEQIEKVKELIYKIYLIDVNTVQNLSTIAKELQKEGLTIPGNIIINGTSTMNNKTVFDNQLSTNNLAVTNNSNIKGPLLLDQNLTTAPTIDSTINSAIYRQNNNMYIASNDSIKFKRVPDSATSTIELNPQTGDGKFNGTVEANYFKATNGIILGELEIKNYGGYLTVYKNGIKQGKVLLT